jgi:hypothetical protein
MYDELKNKSVSKKIIDRKKRFFSPNHITQQTVKKLNNQEYQLLREPYLVLSSKEYMILTTSVFLWNIVLLFIIKNDYLRAVTDFLGL